jgi:hypothetical protein
MGNWEVFVCSLVEDNHERTMITACSLPQLATIGGDSSFGRSSEVANFAAIIHTGHGETCD